MALQFFKADTLEMYEELLDLLKTHPEDATGELAELKGKDILCYIEKGNLLYYNNKPVATRINRVEFIDEATRLARVKYEFVLPETYEDEEGNEHFKTVLLEEAELLSMFEHVDNPYKIDIYAEDGTPNMKPGILSVFDKYRLEVLSKMFIKGTKSDFCANVYDETDLRKFEAESGIIRFNDDNVERDEFKEAVLASSLQKVNKSVYFYEGAWRYDISEEDMNVELEWKVGNRVIKETPAEMNLPDFVIVPEDEIQIKDIDAEVFDIHNAEYQIDGYEGRVLTQQHGNLPQKKADGTDRTADDLKATYGTVSNILNAILFGDPDAIHVEVLREPSCKLVPVGDYDPTAIRPGDKYPSARDMAVEYIPGLCQLVNGDGTAVESTEIEFGNVDVVTSAWIYDMHKDYDRHGRIENDEPYKIIDGTQPYGPVDDAEDHLDMTVSVNDGCVYFALAEFAEIPATIEINGVVYALPSEAVGKTGMYSENAWCFGDIYDRKPYRRALPANEANASAWYENPDNYDVDEEGYHYFRMADLYTYPCIWANVNPEDISLESLYDSKNEEPVAFVEEPVATEIYPFGDETGFDVFVKWPSATTDEQKFQIWTPANFEIVNVKSAHDTFYGQFTLPVILPGKDDAFEVILNEDAEEGKDPAIHQIIDNGVAIDYRKFSIGKVPGITVVKVHISPIEDAIL